jgi:hypothetical protein
LTGPSQQKKLKKEKIMGSSPKHKFLCEDVVILLSTMSGDDKVRTLGKPYGIKLRIVTM